MTATPSEFKTTDLTLSTFLQMEGFESQMVKDGERRNGYPVGAWTFPESDRLRATVDQFNGGKSLVDPKAFHDALNKNREALFGFLGIGKK